MSHGNQSSDAPIRCLYLAAVLFGLFLLCSPRAAEARFWYSGEVTSAETVNDGKIEVNGIMFTFMPRAKVERQYEIGNGVFRNRRMAPGRILKGNTVRMLVEGHRIHRFVRVK